MKLGPAPSPSYIARVAPAETRYVALLRGINVGGSNLIRMTALQLCFEQQGWQDVVTYIQSGNVLFTAAESQAEKLAGRIEGAIGRAFGVSTRVFLRSGKQMRDIVARAPRGFGAQPERYRYDVIYLRQRLSASAVVNGVPVNPEVDRAVAGRGVLYFSRLISKASRSRLSRLMSLPVYKDLTIRNWNTTTRLLQLLEAPI